MPTDPTSQVSYLTKLLVLLIKKAGGVIKVPIVDLVYEDQGEGLQVHYDAVKKELNLVFVPAGSHIYLIKESQSWLTALNPSTSHLPQTPPPPIQPAKQPLASDELVGRAWSESAGTPTLTEEAHQRAREREKRQQGKVVTLSDERQAEIEALRRKAAAIREIEGYQSPEAVLAESRAGLIPSKNLTTFLK